MPQRRHSRFGISLRIGSQVKKSSPSSGSWTPRTSRRGRRMAERARRAPRRSRRSRAGRSGRGCPADRAGRRPASGVGVGAGSEPAAGGGRVLREGDGGRHQQRREREHDEAHTSIVTVRLDAAARGDRGRRRSRAVPARRQRQRADVPLAGARRSDPARLPRPRRVGTRAGHLPDRGLRRRRGVGARVAGPAGGAGRPLARRRRRVVGRQQRPDLVTRRSSKTRRCTWASRRSTHANPAIPIFVETKAAVERWQRGGRRTPTRSRRGSPPCRTCRATAGDVLHDDALAARAYALLHLDPEVIDRIIDGSLLAAPTPPSPVTVPVFVLASDPALSAFTPSTRRGWRPRTRTSRSCASPAPATASTTSARTGTSTRARSSRVPS